jgi:hypothetical protein
MAIGTPTSIGTTSGGTSPVTLATNAAVPAGALIHLVACSGFATDITATASGGSLTWGVGGAGAADQTTLFTSGYAYRIGIFSAPAPAGLALSSNLQIAAPGSDGILISGSYTTGLDTSSSRLDVGTGAGAATTAWNTGSASNTNPDCLIIGGSFLDSLSSSTIHDFQFATNAWTLTSAYKIVSAAASQNLAGTWVAAANHVQAFAAYKAVAAGVTSSSTASGPAVAGEFSPHLNSRMWL